MGEEIFGPLLPVLTYSSLDEAIRTVESHPHPLALYFFSEDKKAQKKSTGSVSLRRRLHQRHHYPSCYQCHAIWRCRCERYGWIPRHGRLQNLQSHSQHCRQKNLDGSSDPVSGVCGMERKTFTDVSAIVFLFLHFQN